MWCFLFLSRPVNVAEKWKLICWKIIPNSKNGILKQGVHKTRELCIHSTGLLRKEKTVLEVRGKVWWHFSDSCRDKILVFCGKRPLKKSRIYAIFQYSV